MNKHVIMNSRKRLLSAVALALGCTTALAAPGPLSNAPLFLSDAVEPNAILILDDSGSMDFEVLFSTNDASAWYNIDNSSFVGLDNNDNPAPGVLNFNQAGNSGDPWWKFSYLFPNGYDGSNRTGSRRSYNSNHWPLPPTLDLAWSRSPNYNSAYYDPSITYEPWVDTGGAYTFGNVDPTRAPWDPIADATTFTVDLTQDIPLADPVDFDWHFVLWTGMFDVNGVAATFPQYYNVAYFPATYFIVDDTATMDIGGTTIDCASPDPANYALFQSNFAAGTVTGTADAIGPDGACMVRYEIRPANTFPSGRSYTDEMQNFANWFTYFRKRHQALRGGIARAIDEIDGVRIGQVRFNNRTTVTMQSLTTDKAAILDSIVTSRGVGGTPTREALDYVGQQYERTDANAPIEFSCQKNYGIVFTDGFANASSISGIGNEDSGQPAPYGDTFSDTLGDIAWNYYEDLDITGFAAGRVPVPTACAAGTDPTLDCNDDLHMTTFGVTLNATGTIFNVTHFDVADAHANPPTWPEPNIYRSPRMVDDLYHAAVNGRGEMLNARTPEEIASRMTDVFEVVIETEGTAAAVTFNTGLLSSDSVVYQAKLDSEDWSGFLTASDLDPITGDVSTTPAWEAADLIPTESARQVATFDGDGVAFRDVADLTAGQLADLSSNLPGGTTAQDVIDYLRGDRTNEDPTLFRERSTRTLLGDIVHSGPVFVGEPTSDWPSVAPFPTGTDAYSTYKQGTAASRRPAVYVGANDGMLHGFWGDTGQPGSGTEFVGYIPDALFSSTAGEGLHALTEQGYVHRYYVDQTPAVSDAFVATDSAGVASWRTILLGSLRGGGKGLFALDVTDPTVMTEANAAGWVMWEFTDADDANLGFGFAEPTIALMNNGRWAAVMGNGYNSTTGAAALMIIYLEGGLDGTWTLGTDYLVIDVPSTGTNGMSTPQLADLDSDGTPDRAYAGDLEGRMWAFDLSSNNDTSWGVDYTSSGTPSPLFTAVNDAGDLQPITSKPVLARCPYDNSVTPDVFVLFGTGQYVAEADKSNTEEQTFYGIWDRGTDDLDRADLLEQLANDPSADVDTTLVRVPTANAFDPLSDLGWYMDLPDAGERVVSNPLVRGEIVFFNTIIPDAGDPCVVGGGGWLMSINICDGGRPQAPVFDLNRDNAVDNGDLVADQTLTDSDGNPITYSPGGERFNQNEGLPWQSSVLGDRQYTPGSTGEIEDRDIDVGSSVVSGRLSWEQIINE
ncbi:MAG: PilC/PilY family type IV pilus protein [Pseudomonadota bacterium]